MKPNDVSLWYLVGCTHRTKSTSDSCGTDFETVSRHPDRLMPSRPTLASPPACTPMSTHIAEYEEETMLLYPRKLGQPTSSVNSSTRVH